MKAFIRVLDQVLYGVEYLPFFPLGTLNELCTKYEWFGRAIHIHKAIFAG